MNKPNATESARQMHADLARLRDAIDAPPQRDDAVEHIAEQIAREAARLAGGEFRPNYNGWTNRETWNTALWISNDESTEEDAAGIVRNALTVDPFENYRAFTGHDPSGGAEGIRRAQLYDAADALEKWWTDHLDDPERNRADDILAGPISDALSYTLAVTDWYRIAEGYAEGIE